MDRRRKDEHEAVAGKNYFSEYLDAQAGSAEEASPSSSSGNTGNTNGSSSDRIAVMDVGPEVEMVVNTDDLTCPIGVSNFPSLCLFYISLILCIFLSLHFGLVAWLAAMVL